ncbi:MAG: alpha-L-rhamnosidase [Ferruginibacter sp.]|nr:alpha-L-rhamnosidase [Ferruginibacter sp.]
MMNRLLLLVGCFIFTTASAQLSVQNLLIENQINPIGIDVANPRFSWQISSDKRNILQTAYEIKVSQSKGTKPVWNSGKIASAQSVQVSYGGSALQSARKYSWQVKVYTNDGKVSSWSAAAFWQMGLLTPADWKAKWIQPGYTEDAVKRPSPLFRSQFNLSKNILSATAFITSHGLYEAFINGQRVGDAWLTPGWTSYNKRLQYQAYDVTKLLKNDKNAIGVALGSGWYRGNLAWNDNKNIYGKELALLFQLQVTYTDGTMATIISDENWKSSVGAIRSSEIYNGEENDAREEKTGWTFAGYDDAKWDGVVTKNFDNNILTATYNEPVKKHEIFHPIKIFKTPSGEQVIDFGQNLVGFVQVKLTGNAGDKIVMHHAEVLDKAGNFYTDNLRAAKQENTYILKGGGEESFEPHFTFQGFRFIKITGLAGEIKPGNFTAVALYSDMQPTGSFSCSHPLLNQLQHNIQWGQKGNFLDVPTDCPQRDERLGWTGDAQVFSRTAAYNMQVNNFFAKWLKDVAADQLPNGSVPFVIPNVLGANSAGSAGWADVATIIPWNMYLAYGDKRILEQQYPSMKAWVGFMEQKSTRGLWNTGFHFGDWLFYRPADDNDGRSAITDKYLIAQCFFAHSTQLLINAAEVLGNTSDATKYSSLLERIKAAFLKEYVTPTGRLVSGSQTAYVLALHFDMLPEALRSQAAERLATNVKDYDNHLTTGFLGTPYLCHVLTRFGYTDVAYKLLLQETYPSWLYPVKMGATTIWERWDGQKPDSTFQTPGMNSFNHYAYGAIGDWMYRVVAGIDTYEDAPGYKHIRIRPHIGGNLTFANADLKTYYGLVSAHWKTENGGIALEVKVPANTTATIYIPAADATAVKEGGASLSDVKNMVVKGKEDGYVIVETGSGSYHFTVDKK